MRSFLRRLWRLGDIEIPIGTPWFAVYGPTAFVRVAFWPIRWQGWAAILCLIAWGAGSVAVFRALGWTPDNRLFLGWMLPTLIVWLGVAVAKTEMRDPRRD
ncbi:MAG TPA: hypothetical protein VG387_18840 [Rhizomicrobium sp.]|nr:hypothetical protein [Rhizomicrobium sp.]